MIVVGEDNSCLVFTGGPEPLHRAPFSSHQGRQHVNVTIYSPEYLVHEKDELFLLELANPAALLLSRCGIDAASISDRPFLLCETFMLQWRDFDGFPARYGLHVRASIVGVAAFPLPGSAADGVLSSTCIAASLGVPCSPCAMHPSETVPEGWPKHSESTRRSAVFCNRVYADLKDIAEDSRRGKGDSFSSSQPSTLFRTGFFRRRQK